MKKKTQKILAGLAAFAILAGLGWFANAFLGNPISNALAGQAAEAYLAETYPGSDFYIDALGYSFKEAGYFAHVQSPSSPDSAFTLSLDMLGRLKYDDYRYRVTERGNTANRLNSAYRALADMVLESPSFPYEAHIAFGDLEFGPGQEADAVGEYPYALPISQLELDKAYDIAQLGERAGHLVLYLYHDPVDMESMAKILLDVKEIFTGAGVPFYAVDLELQYPRAEGDSPRREGSIQVLSFLCSEIYEEGLVERVREADAEAKAYYARQDAEK